MSKTRPRVVLVGAGGYGRLYVEALTSQDMGAELTAICDIDPNLAERVPQIRQRQIPVYPTLDAFFAKDSADLAVLVSPVHFHTDMVLSCLEHGVNVLCEKPLCLTVKEAAAMQEASKKRKIPLHRLSAQLPPGQALKRDICLGVSARQKHRRLPWLSPRRRLLCTQQLGRADHLPGAGSIRQSLYKRVCPSFSDADLSAGTDNAYSL